MKQIKVRCIKSFKQMLSDDNIGCEINEGEEFVSDIDEISEEFWIKDSQGRVTCVGNLNFYGRLVLDECFELVEGGAETKW